jgi:hypothetical protein
VEHGGGADAGAQVPGIGCDREQRFGRHAEQQVVDHRLVLAWQGIWYSAAAEVNSSTVLQATIRRPHSLVRDLISTLRA